MPLPSPVDSTPINSLVRMVLLVPSKNPPNLTPVPGRIVSAIEVFASLTNCVVPNEPPDAEVGEAETP